MTAQLRDMWDEVDQRAGENVRELLSLSQSLGVVPRASVTDKPPRADEFSRYKLCAAGDLVLNRFNAYRGSLGVAPTAGMVSPDYMVARPRPRCCGKYLEYFLRSADTASEMMKRMGGIGGNDPDTSGFARIDAHALDRMEVPVSSFAEQCAIADFLDRETARIDTLIEEQQRLIDLLRERRQAAITRSTASPDGRRVPLVRCMTEQVDYRGATPAKTDSGIQLVTARNVKSGWIDYETSKEFINPDDYAQVMRRGYPRVDDLLFTMEAPLGNAALVDRVDIALAQRVIKWTINRDRAVPKYLLYAILGNDFQFQLRSQATGSTALGIKASKLPALHVSVPSLDEQRRIVAYLDEQMSKIDTLIAETERFIALARERRAALITAAVTGQFDVWDEAAI